MKSQLKPNSWTCLATSFAMAFDTEVGTLFKEIGHDGSQIVAPELPDPASRRGHHPQEFIDLAMRRGISLTYVELVPVLRFADGTQKVVVIGNNFERFRRLIRETAGVVMGTTLGGFQHAMGYDHGTLYDPDTGESFAYDQSTCESKGFYTQCLWIATSKEATASTTP